VKRRRTQYSPHCIMTRISILQFKRTWFLTWSYPFRTTHTDRTLARRVYTPPSQSQPASRPPFGQRPSAPCENSIDRWYPLRAYPMSQNASHLGSSSRPGRVSARRCKSMRGDGHPAIMTQRRESLWSRFELDRVACQADREVWSPLSQRRQRTGTGGMSLARGRERRLLYVNPSKRGPPSSCSFSYPASGSFYPDRATLIVVEERVCAGLLFTSEMLCRSSDIHAFHITYKCLIVSSFAAN
jgi:hypothetical protein